MSDFNKDALFKAGKAVQAAMKSSGAEGVTLSELAALAIQTYCKATGARMKNDTITDEIEGLRAIAKAAFAFNDCASEFQGDLTCCQESIDALYVACERHLNDAAAKPTRDASGKRIDGYGDPAKGEYNAFLADDGSDIPCD